MELRYPTPPPASPSTSPALGVALATNVLLAAGAHMGLSFAHGFDVKDDLTASLLGTAPVVYLVMLLPTIALYGIAAAAWTGWSWWRVPVATLAGSVLALGFNAWSMAHWISHKGWQVGPTLSVADGRVDHLAGLAFLAFGALLLVAFSLWPRWFREEDKVVAQQQ